MEGTSKKRDKVSISSLAPLLLYSNQASLSLSLLYSIIFSGVNPTENITEVGITRRFMCCRRGARWVDEGTEEEAEKKRSRAENEIPILH